MSTETKQIAVDFSKWIETNEWFHNYKWQRTLTKEELYDIFAAERTRSVAVPNTSPSSIEESKAPITR
jgi:hypothetical protein